MPKPLSIGEAAEKEHITPAWAVMSQTPLRQHGRSQKPMCNGAEVP